MTSTQTLERIHLRPDPQGLGLMRGFEAKSPFAAPLLEIMAGDAEQAPSTRYLGLVNGSGELVARARLLVSARKLLLVDDLEAIPGQGPLLRELIRFATEEAQASGRRLAVLAPADDFPDWTQLGFHDTGQRLLML